MTAPEDGAPKKNALPLQTNKARTAAAKKAEARAEKNRLDRANEQQLAQIINLLIAGHSLGDIGNSIGMSADEVDRLLSRNAARYVRNQPQLRVYVRNWISSKYSDLLEAVWDDATDKTSPKKLESQDRAMRVLDSMRKLHGADAPVQTEVKVEAAPEMVEKMVAVLSEQAGVGYDTSIFDIVDAEVIHDVADEAHAALEAASHAVEHEEDEPDDE